ncbi:uncharacterized protein LY79DRAFT_545162 [Colletotrichum navitas]|uniref:Uncharacterized protein n=1 Tax=Colletotrichum navitas TaxID=681940 RepID=A0AAD8Q549_9PEZI|nr:uncharacterized protein LY79DRAFT_545162 [Colletotrichum navitas]KAK1596040.1 hypothetical protein LY79DRAFT_545162 [Colletotrichum navitas]
MQLVKKAYFSFSFSFLIFPSLRSRDLSIRSVGIPVRNLSKGPDRLRIRSHTSSHTGGCCRDRGHGMKRSLLISRVGTENAQYSHVSLNLPANSFIVTQSVSLPMERI